VRRGRSTGGVLQAAPRRERLDETPLAQGNAVKLRLTDRAVGAVPTLVALTCFGPTWGRVSVGGLDGAAVASRRAGRSGPHPPTGYGSRTVRFLVGVVGVPSQRR
jgi:hypothetical protein